MVFAWLLLFFVTDIVVGGVCTDAGVAAGVCVAAGAVADVVVAVGVAADVVVVVVSTFSLGRKKGRVKKI